ncbi:MAG: GIY-YIG nuclease family protein [Clostridia bacterium]|nr:GIY-YIG nuclease family protein [Clostridia bacterium]
MAYYVYILTNRYRNVLYTGMTNDLIRRVYEHRNHLIKDSFTARYNVTRLVYFEMTEDVRSAIEREKQIKSWPRARKDQLVETQNPTWEDQYPMLLGG